VHKLGRRLDPPDLQRDRIYVPTLSGASSRRSTSRPHSSAASSSSTAPVAAVAYEAALHHEAVHAAQHVALFVGGVLLWAPIFELTSTPKWFGDGGRLVYLLLTMFAGVVLGALLLWWPRTLYSTYAHAGGFAGLTAHSDQRAGGGIMMLEGTLVTFAVAAWVMWRIFRVDGVAGREPDPARPL
jgi:cytochrome c oxidase assembly factor CtaG